ncbi:MAG: acyl-CoA dehydrogenase family protein [Micropepsaceae bacterium]
MDESRKILEESANKLFAGFAEPALLRRVEAGEDVHEVWTSISEMGFDQIFAGASDDPWRDACVVLKACGRHVLPAPLPETLMAGALMQMAGVTPVEGAVTLGAPQNAELALADGGDVTGRASHLPWGRACRHAVLPMLSQLLIVPMDERTQDDRSIGREPRDTHVFVSVTPVANGTLDSGLFTAAGALMRAAQMAGAIEAVLEMTVQYARERQQFGKPIGSFQAIQHQLAILAGHSAAAMRAVDQGFERIAESGADKDVILFEAAIAKIRCGEAATAAASIAHQTHGAIGFTDEHRLHYFTRRLWSWRSEFGSSGWWSERLGRQVSAAGNDAFWPMVTAAG